MIDRLEQLQEWFSRFDQAIVALSGGMDSSVLTLAAHKALGNRMKALTISSCLVPEEHIEFSRTLTSEHGIPHQIINVDLLSVDSIRSNDPHRCYYCKRHIYETILQQAPSIENHVITEGTNASDIEQHRPGLRALKELRIRSPLLELGFDRTTVRNLAGSLGLPEASDPSSGCLATRFPYHTELSLDQLARVEQAEHMLHHHGFHQVRVRVHGQLARLEVPRSDLVRLLEENTRSEITHDLQQLGFSRVTADLDGYRSGSWDATGNEERT